MMKHNNKRLAKRPVFVDFLAGFSLFLLGAGGVVALLAVLADVQGFLSLRICLVVTVLVGVAWLTVELLSRFGRGLPYPAGKWYVFWKPNTRHRAIALGATTAPWILKGVLPLIATPMLEPEVKNLCLEVRIYNSTEEDRLVSSLAEYVLTESVGALVIENPGGRGSLTPSDGLEGLVVRVGATRRLRLRFNTDSGLLAVLARGGANIHFVLRLDNGAFLIESAPFIQSSFGETYIEYDLSGMVGARDDESSQTVPVQLRATLIDDAEIALRPKVTYQVQSNEAPFAFAAVGGQGAISQFVNDLLKKHTLRVVEAKSLAELRTKRAELEDSIAEELAIEASEAWITIVGVRLGEIEVRRPPNAKARVDLSTSSVLVATGADLFTQFGDSVLIRNVWKAPVDDLNNATKIQLLKALRNGYPIVHVAAQFEANGVELTDGRVSGGQFEDLFVAAGNQTTLVVLAGCSSFSVGKALERSGVRYSVVATSDLRLDVARKFFAEFYSRLAAGVEPVQAFTTSKAAVEVEFGGGSSTPLFFSEYD